jgi:Transposase DDE domain
MNTKIDCKTNQLVANLKEKTQWNLAHVRFLVAFISAVCKLQTVNFIKLAQGFGGTAKVESNHRRIQRFFAKFFVDEDLIVKIIFALLPVEPPYRLCLDRTNWKFGTIDINILTIGVCYYGVAIPLMWTMLPKRGNSNQKERTDLINRYIGLFGTASIDSILADREFIGDEWIAGLIALKVLFFFRIKENMWVNVPNVGQRKAFWLFNNLPLHGGRLYRKIVQVGTQWVFLSGSKYLNRDGKLEFIIIATYTYNPQTLTIYRDRWQIETMFRALKTSGFNLEDTHLNDLERISKLLCLLCIAFIWAYLTGIYRHENMKPIQIKKHGRKAYSYFKYGLIFIAHALLCLILPDIDVIIKILSCT